MRRYTRQSVEDGLIAVCISLLIMIVMLAVCGLIDLINGTL